MQISSGGSISAARASEASPAAQAGANRGPWPAFRPSDRGRALALASAGTVAATTYLVTIRRVVPLNRQVHTWDAAEPPPQLDDVRARWRRLHAARTAGLVGALLLQAAATTLETERTGRARRHTS